MGGRGASAYNDVSSYVRFKPLMDRATELDDIEKRVLDENREKQIYKYFMAEKPSDTKIKIYKENGKYRYDITKDKKNIATGLTEKQAKNKLAEMTQETNLYKVLKADRENRNRRQ